MTCRVSVSETVSVLRLTSVVGLPTTIRNKFVAPCNSSLNLINRFVYIHVCQEERLCFSISSQLGVPYIALQRVIWICLGSQSSSRFLPFPPVSSRFLPFPPVFLTLYIHSNQAPPASSYSLRKDLSLNCKL